MNDSLNTMKIFLDTADTQAIKDGYDTGLVDGITTNPSLIMKSGRDPEDVYQELIDLGISDISMEVVGNRDQMLWEGRRLANKFGKEATIKVPCTPDGLYVCRQLSRSLVKVNVTLIFSPSQAILAASIRIVRDVGRAFEYGANICTIPTGVFDKMYKHVLTDAGLAQFDEDWRAVQVGLTD